MVTRARTQWVPNKRGYYERQIGWKISSRTGGHHQHKVTLGKNLQEAQWREQRIRELWERHEKTRNEPRPLWPPLLLDIAKQLAKGHSRFLVERKVRELPVTYAGRITRLESNYPVIAYIPRDERAYEIGKEALRVLEGPECRCQRCFG